MNGRREHEIKINKKIEDIIKDYPEYLSDFNISMEAEGLTHNTRLTYMRSVLRYLNYLKDNGKDIFDTEIFKEINTISIKKYFVETRYKEGTDEQVEKSGSFVNVEQRGLSFFFRFLMESEIIDKNPFRIDGQPIKIGKNTDIHITIALDENETATMYQNIDEGVGSQRSRNRQKPWKDRDLAIIDLALNTGLRISALTEINISDIDFENQTIDVIEKGNKKSRIEIDSKSAELLKQWINRRRVIMGDEMEKTDALFISNRKERISQNAVRSLVAKYSTGIDKHVTPHKLRSTFATAIIRETGDQHAVQTALGHSGGVTDRYLGNKAEEKRKAVNAARKYYQSANKEEK